jgi:hypothetical protein
MGSHELKFGQVQPPPVTPEDAAGGKQDKQADSASSGGRDSQSAEDKARRRRAKDFLALGAILTLAFCLFTNVIDVDAELPEGVEA